MKKKIILLILFIIVIILLVYLMYRLNFIKHKMYTNEDFNIKKYTSLIDKDNDGIDDQTDILENVRKYIDTNPQYQSKYYDGGYPTDNYGVCTDVVAFGLLGSGYDLKELVYNDIKNNRDKYDIEIIDKNIDFRRVKNLKIYFNHHAIKLTNDIRDINNWQGGDIVIFDNHIGIVSDMRNKNGIPFIIHHANPYQKYYEEDILEYRTDLYGHFRIS